MSAFAIAHPCPEALQYEHPHNLNAWEELLNFGRYVVVQRFNLP